MADLLNKTSATETVIENRIFIGGIPPHADENDVRNFLTSTFEKFGIKDVKIIFDKTGASNCKGYAFITFETKEAAHQILTSPDYENLLYKERKLNISKAIKKNNNYPKTHVSPSATVVPNTGPVQYVLLQGQDGLPLGYAAQSMLPLQYYGPYGSNFFVTPGPHTGAGASSALVSQSSPHVQCQSIQWAAAAAAAALPTHQALQFLNTAAAPAGAASAGLQCFNAGGRAGAGDLLCYAPSANGYNGSLTSDYNSSYSDPNSSMDAGGTDSESSPARGATAADCQSIVFSPGPPALPLYQYTPMKSHQTSLSSQQQQPRFMPSASALGGRGDTRMLKYGN